MKKAFSPDDNPQDARDLARFAAVQTVLQTRQAGQTMAQALRQAAQQTWDGRYFAASTIEDWFYAHKNGRFAALQHKPRRDRGTNRSLDPVALEALVKLRREHPDLTVRALAAELVRRGILEEGRYSDSTLQRRLAEAGLDRQSLRAGGGANGGPTKAFELPLPNLLWMTDCMHGPAIKLGRGQVQRTFLFALIDDCSRLLIHGQFYAAERLECFLDALRHGVQSRGICDKLYTDNGKVFKSQHLQIVCANLGIKLLHAKPYAAWSKGKIERFFGTCRSVFLPKLMFDPVHTMEDLNRRFWQWTELEYNRKEHSSLQGESPADRFARLGQSVRLLGAGTDIEKLFLMRVQRRVRKDATFSLAGEFWEVPAHLRGQVVTVHFDPITFNRVEVWMGERFIGKAIRCNKHRNAQLISSNDYASGTS